MSVRPLWSDTLPLFPEEAGPPVSCRAKPFLKWAGGKSQLLPQIDCCLPEDLKTGRIRRYVEPFVGGGAVFFHIAQSYRVPQCVLMDVNEELILVYQTIKSNVDDLIDLLGRMEREYRGLTPHEQCDFFYRTRVSFNEQKSEVDFVVPGSDWVGRAAQLLFLNRTCFNGLFRLNSRGHFNVPFGRYANPLICGADNLREVAKLLRQTEILRGDFEESDQFVDKDTFVYFDPPYRPISRTASFTAYSSFEFDDRSQRRLASYFRRLDARAARLMLSNSDPKNENPDDDFFDEIFDGFCVRRVRANRMINSNPNRRGQISEVLVTNY